MNRKNPTQTTVREYRFSSRSAGMLFNSNTLRAERIFRQGGTPLLFVRDKPAFGTETTTLYRMPEALFARLQSVVDSADVFALAALTRGTQAPIAYDSSGSADCSLVVDRQTAAGSEKNIVLRLDPAAIRENGCGAFLDAIRGIVAQAAVPENVTDPSAAQWQCERCGHTETTDVRFCPACGCPRSR